MHLVGSRSYHLTRQIDRQIDLQRVANQSTWISCQSFHNVLSGFLHEPSPCQLMSCQSNYQIYILVHLSTTTKTYFIVIARPELPKNDTCPRWYSQWSWSCPQWTAGRSFGPSFPQTCSSSLQNSFDVIQTQKLWKPFCYKKRLFENVKKKGHHGRWVGSQQLGHLTCCKIGPPELSRVY